MPSAPALGDVVAGRYRLVAVRARGASAIVFEAIDVRDGQRIAVKVLRPEVLGYAGIAQRFEQEAKLLASLTSPHVVRVLDIGRTDAGLPCLALELLEGHDLGVEIARGRLEVGRATVLVRQACAALAEAHDRGIVHRDVKPQNLFLAKDTRGRETIRVLDFGISKDDSHHEALTTAGAPLGTPVYMAPEQILSAHAVDARCDVWALGVVLFEMLAGRAPFEAESAQEVASLVLASTPAPSLSAFRPDVPQALDEIVAQCLEKDPSRRLSSVRALETALAPFDVPRPPEAPERTATVAAPKMSRRALAAAIVAGLAIGVLAITLVILVVRRLRQGDASPLVALGLADPEPTIGDVLSRASADADAWRPCLVRSADAISLPALAPLGSMPEPERDLDALFSAARRPRLTLQAPWVTPTPSGGALVLAPITPLAPAFRRGPVDVLAITNDSVRLGRVGGSVLTDLGDDPTRIVERLSNAPLLLLVEGETPLAKLAAVSAALARHAVPMAIAVVPRRAGEWTDKGGGLEACAGNAQGPPLEPARRAALDVATREVAARCARALPAASGSKLDVLVRSRGGAPPSVCLESAEVPSTRLLHCVAAGLRGAADAEMGEGVAHLSLVFEVPEVRPLCGPGD